MLFPPQSVGLKTSPGELPAQLPVSRSIGISTVLAEISLIVAGLAVVILNGPLPVQTVHAKAEILLILRSRREGEARLIGGFAPPQILVECLGVPAHEIFPVITLGTDGITVGDVGDGS